MTDQHTPGPWKALPPSRGFVCVIAPTTSEKCGPLEICAIGDVSRVDIANAALIAAAPALLAALTELHRLVEVTDNIVETSDRYGIYHNDMMDALDAAEVAIKQARGE